MDTNQHISTPDRHNWEAFQKAFRSQAVIPMQEIGLRFPDMHRSRLSQWQRRGLLLKVRNGFYRLADRPINEQERWAIANTIYTPSYVSLRTALSHYSFIPEGVFHVESVTTIQTKRFTFDGTEYSYRNVRPNFYYGYRFVEQNGAASGGQVRAMMATPEKALLDLLYLEPSVDGPEGFDAWRLNPDEINAVIDPARMDELANTEGSRALLTRYRRLKRWLRDRAG